jgi:hypothetical protein
VAASAALNRNFSEIPNGAVARCRFTLEERRGFTEHLNQSLAGDADLAGFLPMDPNSNALFDVVAQGLLLAYVAALCFPFVTLRRPAQSVVARCRFACLAPSAVAVFSRRAPPAAVRSAPMQRRNKRAICTVDETHFPCSVARSTATAGNAAAECCADHRRRCAAVVSPANTSTR